MLNLSLVETAAHFLMFQGGPNSIKNQYQDEANMEQKLESNSEQFWEPSWGQNGGQEAS